MKAMAVLSALLLVTACTSGSTAGRPAPTPSHTAPAVAPAGRTVMEPPRGRRWVGTQDVVVAVPLRWGTETQPCAEPDGDTVFFAGRSAAALDCPTVPTAHVSSLTIASPDSGVVPPGKRVDLEDEVNGLRVTHTGIACRASSTGPCTLTFLVAGVDAAFRIVYRGERPEVFVNRVYHSLTRVPAGQTTVPLVEYGTSVLKAQKRLSRAGLVGRAPDVDFPHYVTGTRPPAGTVLELGEDVELTIGDG